MECELYLNKAVKMKRKLFVEELDLKRRARFCWKAMGVQWDNMNSATEAGSIRDVCETRNKS